VEDVTEDEIEWKRYYGKIKKQKLLEKLVSNYEYLLLDGGHQFCVRDGNTGDYFAIDDHAVVFIYSSRKEYRKVLTDLGFKNKKDELIFEIPHWHVMLEDSEKLQKQLVEDLGLEVK